MTSSSPHLTFFDDARLSGTPTATVPARFSARFFSLSLIFDSTRTLSCARQIFFVRFLALM